MESIVLAKIFGLFCTIFGISALLHTDHMKSVVQAVLDNSGLQLVAGIVPLLIGSFLVSTHNYWVNDWTVLVTIGGWLMFVGGVIRVLCHSFWIKTMRKNKDSGVLVIAPLVMSLLGIALIYFGFFA